MIEKRYCLTPEEWAYAKAELVLAEKLGLIENADIEALEKRCAEKNEENARLEMEKKVFYGPRRYSLPMYLQYELTRFRLDFVQPTENIRKSGISPEITENQKKAFYERNKDLFGRYFGDLFSYEEVEQIIEKNIGKLFVNYEIESVFPYRIMRNADLSIEEDEAADLLIEIERQLKKRQWGQAIRLEVEAGMDKRLLKKLRQELKIKEEDIFKINGPLDLTFLMKLSGLEGYDKLRTPKYTPQPAKWLNGEDHLFDQIRDHDVLLHHPYETFDPVVDFVKQASKDPNVLAIKQTLYRVSSTVMMRGYYADVPDALIRQAMIDGNGVWQIYRKIVLPNTKIATITVFVFQCTSIWNEMLFALVLGGYDSKPATIALNELAGTMAAEFNVQMAGSLILALPVLVLYIFMGKYLISGQMSGAVTAS